MVDGCAPVPAFQSGGVPLGIAGSSSSRMDRDTVPAYLQAYYWWAYVHPCAVKVFERQWLVNLILWGNYARLRDAALAEFGQSLSGKTLQVACAYGNLTNHLSRDAARAGGSV